MKKFLLIMLFAVAGAGNAIANHHPGAQHSAQPQAPQAPAAIPKTGKGTGLIQQIDREKGAVTIKDGSVLGLNMPGIPMSFLVKDKAMLSKLQPLQKVDFELTYDGSKYLITKIKTASPLSGL